jgi:hypothetical protein
MAKWQQVRLALTACYLALAILTWWQFALTAHDGLANVGLLIVALPYTLIGLLATKLLGASDFVLIPRNAGYLTAHAMFFVPGVLLTAFLIWGIITRFGQRDEP